MESSNLQHKITFNFLQKEEQPKRNRKEYHKRYHEEHKEEINQRKRSKYQKRKPPNFQLKTKKEIDHDYYQQKKSEILLTKKNRNNSTHRHTCRDAKRNSIKDTCFCQPNRKDKKRLLICSLDHEKKRMGSVNKNPSINGKDWQNKKEKRNWKQLRIDFNQIGIRGGQRLGRGYDYWDDCDLLNKPTYKKGDSNWKEPWQERTLINNFDQKIKQIKVIYAKTRHGRRINVNACCEWPHLKYYYSGQWGKQKVAVGDLRGKGLYTVIDGKGYDWQTKRGVLSWRFRCQQLEPKGDEEVGKIKTCLQQFIQAKKALFYIDCIIYQNKSKTNEIIRKNIVKDTKRALFIEKAQIIGVKPRKDNYYQIDYHNRQKQRRYFVLNADQDYQPRQAQAKDLFMPNSVHTLQLLRGNHQIFFNRLIPMRC